MTTLGLILARGGSKRVPGKNMRMLGDVPLIQWSIWAAYGAQCLDQIVVSSDDDGILDYALNRGVDAIKRPPELASDEASSYPAMLHAIDGGDQHHETLCLLQPTSPFRSGAQIKECLDTHKAIGAPAMVSKVLGQRVPNGAIYIAEVEWLRESLAAGNEAPFDSAVPTAYYMDADSSIDIDTEEDFEQAQVMVRRYADKGVA